MSGWRTMQVDGRVWRYRFGRGNAVIRDDADKPSVVDYSALTGRAWTTIERGQWKKTGDGMVKPGHVLGWIRKHLLAPVDGPAKRGASHRRKPPTASDRPPVGAGSAEEPGSLFDRLEER